MNIEPKDLPHGIRRWAENILSPQSNFGRGRKLGWISVEARDTVTIQSSGSDTSRDYWAAFVLTEGDATQVGSTIVRKAANMFEPHSTDRTTTRVEPGTVLCRLTVGYKVVMLYVFTGEGAVFALPPPPELTDGELTCVLQASHLKSAYRDKWKPEVYASLIDKGLLNKNKSVTASGRNVADNITYEKKDALRKKFGWRSVP